MASLRLDIPDVEKQNVEELMASIRDAVVAAIAAGKQDTADGQMKAFDESAQAEGFTPVEPEPKKFADLCPCPNCTDRRERKATLERITRQVFARQDAEDRQRMN